MIISVKHKFAFYHVNKCGGTSITKVLNDLAGANDIQFTPKHIPLKDINFDISDLIIYANIRNPFDRIVSIYETRRQKTQKALFAKISFKEFFYNWYIDNDDNAFRAIHEYLFIDDKLPRNVVPVKLEDADLKWSEIIYDYFNRRIDKIPRLNTTTHKNPMTYFNKNMIAEVNDKEWWAIEQYAKR